MILEIKKEGDPILRQQAASISEFGFEFQAFVDNMIETLRVSGIGLAAPQVGISKQIIVVEFAGDKENKLKGFPLTVLVNPKIIQESKRKRNLVEGCLSVPGREIAIRRPERVTVVGQDRYGKKVKIETNGLHARALQHEIDHLEGILITDHMREVRVIFIGTGSLAVPALRALMGDPQYKIMAVVTGSAQSKVRGKARDKNEIARMADRAKLRLIRTEKIGDEKIIDDIKKLRPELGIVADFGQIIPEEILALPKYGALNIHPSLLPRHRGASPIQSTILEGDKITGVTIIKATKAMDAGPIVGQASVELSGSETSTILKTYLAQLGTALLLESIPYYLSKEIKPLIQDEAKASYTRIIKKDDGLVDKTAPAQEVDRKVRAFNEWPKVSLKVGERRVQLLSGHFDQEGNYVPDLVKVEGKSEMSYTDFKNGYRAELTFEPSSGKF